MNLVNMDDVIKLVESPETKDRLVALLMESYDKGVADTKEAAIQAVSKAVAAEREACANVCEELGMATNGMYERNHECAKAIRARGN